MKKYLCMVLVLCFAIANIFTFSSVFAADREIKVLFDGEEVKFEAAPVIIDGRMLVPMREMFELLGATIEWNGETKTVTGKKGGLTITLTIGSKNAGINTRNITLDVPAALINSKTFVPARFVTESLGANISWDAANYAAVIDTAKPGASISVSNTSDLADAVNNAKPGDTIILKDGIYENAELTFTGKGTSIAYITVKPDSPGGVQFTSDSQVVFDNAEYITFKDFYFNNNIRLDNGSDYEANANVLIKGKSSYINISNNKFYKSGNNSHSFGPIVFVTGANYNTIENNTFEASEGVSVTIRDGSMHTLIRGNHFKNINSSDSVFTDNNGMECLLIGSQADRDLDLYTIAEYNLFENVTGDGSEIVSNKSSSNIYRYNTFRDCPSMFTLRFGDDCTVEGNYFYNMKGGIRAYGAGHTIINNYIESAKSGAYYASIKLGHGDAKSYQAADNAQVINNTIINPKGVGMMIGKAGTDVHPENVIIKNNFISADNGTAIVHVGGKAVFTNNLLRLFGTAVAGVSGDGISQVTIGSSPLTSENAGCEF